MSPQFEYNDSWGAVVALGPNLWESTPPICSHAMGLDCLLERESSDGTVLYHGLLMLPSFCFGWRQEAEGSLVQAEDVAAILMRDG